MTAAQQTTAVQRCAWAQGDQVYQDYHDHEWGIPLHDEHRLFEMLILEGFQAGLSWITILRKRPAFTRAFCNWDWQAVAALTAQDVERLMSDASIVRNRLKITAAIRNAQAFMRVRDEFASFDRYIWQFSDYTTLRAPQRATTFAQLPTRSTRSDAMSRDLRRRGFSFVGSTICYAFMQAIGMVDDHLAGCFKVSV